MKKELRMSASRIKVLKSCSFLYWAKYVLKLFDTTNEGAQRGTAIHTIFECLMKSRHKHHFKDIIKKGSIRGSRAVSRYIEIYIRKLGMSDGTFEKIDGMIMQGLNNDFFCKGGKVVGVELEFDIKSEEPKYNLMGYIDRIVHYDNKFSRIQDWKSSSKPFTEEELKTSIQAMCYALSEKKKNPALKPIVDFMMLLHASQYVQRASFTDSQLLSFEMELAEYYEKMVNFSEKDAKANMAARQPYPPAGGGFCGPIMCGRAKYPGQLKKDGTVMWACSFRFPRDYFALCDEDGSVLRTAATKEELKANSDKGEFVIKKRYSGCPAHARQNNENEAQKTAEAQTEAN